MRTFYIRCLLAVLSLLMLFGCTPKHACVFDQKTPDAAFLASEGNCTAPSSYY